MQYQELGGASGIAGGPGGGGGSLRQSGWPSHAGAGGGGASGTGSRHGLTGSHGGHQVPGKFLPAAGTEAPRVTSSGDIFGHLDSERGIASGRIGDYQIGTLYPAQFTRPSAKEISPYKILLHAHTVDGCVVCSRMYHGKWYRDNAADSVSDDEPETDGDMANRVICEACYASRNRARSASGVTSVGTARGRRFPCRQFVILSPSTHARMMSDIAFNKSAVFPPFIKRKLASSWHCEV